MNKNLMELKIKNDLGNIIELDVEYVKNIKFIRIITDNIVFIEKFEKILKYFRKKHYYLYSLFVYNNKLYIDFKYKNGGKI